MAKDKGLRLPGDPSLDPDVQRYRIRFQGVRWLCLRGLRIAVTIPRHGQFPTCWARHAGFPCGRSAPELFVP